eukprot:symbB.v1.2.005446.t1/scaffold318.1/size313828/9
MSLCWVEHTRCPDVRPAPLEQVQEEHAEGTKMRAAGLKLSESEHPGPLIAIWQVSEVIPFQEPFDLAVALRPHLLKSSLLGHVMVEAAGDLRLFSQEHLDMQKRQGKILCRGCGVFFQDGNPLRTHVQNSKDARCFSAEAAEYYVRSCQDGEVVPVEVVKKSLPLGFQAARDGDLKKLQGLIENGWDPHTVDHHGNTVLHWAAGSGHVEILHFLVSMKMDPCGASAKHQNRCSLHWAARNGQVAACEYLLDHQSFVDVETDGGDTPLMLSAWQGHVECCAFLVQRRADLHHLNSWGCNAMHKAARMDGQHSSLEMLQFLLSHNVAASRGNCNGHNALHKAAQFGSVSACRLLLDHGLKTRKAMAPDRERNSPSSLAFAAGYHRLAAELRHTEDVLWLVPAIYRAPDLVLPEPDLPSTEHT